jgi:hypothetical protein
MKIVYFLRDAHKIGDIHHTLRRSESQVVFGPVVQERSAVTIFFGICVLESTKQDGKRYRLGIHICRGDFRGAGNL